jgi:ribonuclease III
MSKRQFSEVSHGATDEDVSHIIRHAEELLQAAQALKQSLDAGRQDQAASERLQDINRKLSPAIENLGQISGSSNKTAKIDRDESAANSISIPSPAAVGSWTEIASDHPPLPPIPNPILETAVFTHAGKTRPGEMSYERLEWVGDAYLYLISSILIYQTFPNLSAGRCSQYRELLIRNKTLSQFTTGYRLDRRLNFPLEFALEGNSGGNQAASKQKRKVLGDVFEAYVAGVILADPVQGLATASTWMKSLWSMELRYEILKELDDQAKRQVQTSSGNDLVVLAGPSTQSGSVAQNPAPPKATPELGPKVLLAQAIATRGVKIYYQDEGEPKAEKRTGLPWYIQAVYLDGWGKKGVKMGYGSGFSKKEAGAKAAQAALNNKKLIAEFQQKKKDFEAAGEAQKEYAQ